MQILLGSDLCGQKSRTMSAYVGGFPSAYIFTTCAWFTTKIEFFPLVFVLLLPWTLCLISFPKPVCHVSHTSGSASCASFLYWVIVFTVFRCTIAAKSVRYLHRGRCLALLAPLDYDPRSLLASTLLLVCPMQFE